MFSDEVEEALMNLGRIISEVRFKKMPEHEVLELLCEKSSGTRIYLDLVAPISLSEASDISCAHHVASVRLKSEFLSDWAELERFSALEELELTISPPGKSSFDPRDLAGMQLVILNLQNLRRLTLDVSNLYPDQLGEIKRAMIFHRPDLEVSFRERNKGRKRLSRKKE